MLRGAEWPGLYHRRRRASGLIFTAGGEASSARTNTPPAKRLKRQRRG